MLYNLRPGSVSPDELRDTSYAAEPEVHFKAQVRGHGVYRYTVGIGLFCVLLVIAKKTYFRMLVA